MNPTLGIGLLIAWIASLATVGWWQNGAGHVAERTACQARESTQLIAANAKIKTLSDAARKVEQDHAAQLAAISTTYQKDLKDAHTQRLADIAAVRAGFRLRLPAPSGTSPNGNSLPQVATSPCRCNGTQGPDLPAATTDDLLALANDADTIVRQLAACQAMIRQDRAQEPK